MPLRPKRAPRRRAARSTRHLGAVGLVAAALLVAGAAAADDAPISLRYDVNAKEIAQGETFQLDVVLTVHSQQPVEEVALPDIPRGLTVVQERRASSTQIGNVNGHRSITVEQRYLYLLRGDEAGTFKIPEATARLGRFVAHAPALTVKVVADPSSSAAAPPGVPEPAGALPGARFGRRPPASFLEVTLDRDSAVVGQQVTATTEVYSQRPLGEFPRLAPLKPPGFFCTPLLGDDRPNPSQKSVAGHLYYVYLVNMDALFPVKAGDVTIPAQTVDLQPAGSFFSRPRGVRVKSAAVTLHVSALPGADMPAGFPAGNVGIWQLTSTVRPSSASLDQPVTLTIVANGTGSLEQLQLPTWDAADAEAAGARVFPSTTKIDRRQTSADEPELGGRVVIEMLVQPEKVGQLHIPAFTLSFFDPFARAYKTSSTRPIVVPVRAARSASSSSASPAPGSRQTIAKGARPLRGHVSAQTRPGEAPVAAGGAAFVAGLGVLAARARQRKKGASLEGKRASKRRDRQRALDDAKARGDLAGLERILLEAVADRCGAEAKSRATGDLAAFLAERGLERAAADDVVRFIRDVEAARYSPGGSSERARLADVCVALIARVEAA